MKLIDKLEDLESELAKVCKNKDYNLDFKQTLQILSVRLSLNMLFNNLHDLSEEVIELEHLIKRLDHFLMDTMSEN